MSEHLVVVWDGDEADLGHGERGGGGFRRLIALCGLEEAEIGREIEAWKGRVSEEEGLSGHEASRGFEKDAFGSGGGGGGWEGGLFCFFERWWRESKAPRFALCS